MQEVVFFTDIDEQCPWGMVLRELLPFFVLDGIQPWIRARKRKVKHPAVWKDYMVYGYRAVPWEIMIGPANQIPTPKKKTLWITSADEKMGELGIRALNLAEIIVVPSRWDRNRLSAMGVKRPIEVVPFGYNSMIFGTKPGDVFYHRVKAIFGTTLNDDFPIVHGNFTNAFPNIDGVELWARVFDDRTVPADSDQRIKYFSGPDVQHWNRIETWFKSLNCYVTLKQDGLGLSAIQAMACGVPVMGNAIGSKTEFLNEKTGYPITPETPVSGTVQAHFYAQFRRILLDQASAFERGQKAAKAVRTWEQTYLHLRQVLDQHRIVQA